MFGRDVLKSAASLLAAAGLLLPRRRAPGDLASAPSKATAQEQLLRSLLTGGAGNLLSVEVGGGPAACIVRCRFARGSDLDACASWVEAVVHDWLRQRTRGTFGVEISRGVFAPVVEARAWAK
jgi:hypothetical protein